MAVGNVKCAAGIDKSWNSLSFVQISNNAALKTSSLGDLRTEMFVTS